MGADRYQDVLASAVEDEPSAAAIARLEARLAPVLGGPPAPAAPSAAGGMDRVLSWKVVLGIGLVVAPLTAWLWFAAARDGPAPPLRAVGVAVRSEPPHAPPPPRVDPVPVAAQASPPPAVEPSAAPGRRASQGSASPRDLLAEEVRLLQNAQDVLVRDPAATLRIGEEHRARFPRGTLTQEREVLVIDALMRLGRSEAARRRAAGFHQRFVGSSHGARVDALVLESPSEP